jgi:hypothetical protein
LWTNPTKTSRQTRKAGANVEPEPTAFSEKIVRNHGTTSKMKKSANGPQYDTHFPEKTEGAKNHGTMPKTKIKRKCASAPHALFRKKLQKPQHKVQMRLGTTRTFPKKAPKTTAQSANASRHDTQFSEKSAKKHGTTLKPKKSDSAPRNDTHPNASILRLTGRVSYPPEREGVGTTFGFHVGFGGSGLKFPMWDNFWFSCGTTFGFFV